MFLCIFFTSGRDFYTHVKHLQKNYSIWGGHITDYKLSFNKGARGRGIEKWNAHCHQKTRGIFFVVCTSPLLDIHRLKYDFDTFTKT
jgi:hypothetical protein